jgi:serine phosphatase RsbU (regulator of sigma subunit)/tetratricopeptide (TPR) repeat protein
MMSSACSWDPGRPGLRRVGDYLLGPELGEGAMSVVYRATRGDHAYALKIAAERSSVSLVDLHLQFRREAAAIARLDHPSLIHVVEVGDSAGRPYLVMELAEGEGLDRRLARGPLSEPETVAMARSLAAALAEVHRFRLVHRDVKPANIVLGPTGAVKLIDFGLVTGATDGDAIVGTLAYAAPEQLGVLERTVGPPADLYALGATLFECLTGSPPIQGDTQSDLLHHLAVTPAPALTSRCPQASPALSAILAKLLSKDPDDRYQSAGGLLSDLESLPALDEAARAGRPFTLGARDRLASGGQEVPLCGRDDELARLRRAFERAAGGEISFALLEGEGGSGRGRIVQEVTTAALERGALVLSGQCQDREAAPFGPLREAVNGLASRVLRLPEPARQAAIDRVRRAAGAFAPLLARLSVGLGRLLGDLGTLRALEPDAEEQRFFEAIAGFFRSLALPSSPLVLVVEDVQWLDEGSQRVLDRLAADRASAPLLLLATARSDAVPGASAGRLSAIGRYPDCERVTLGPLGPAAVSALVVALLGGKPVDGQLIDKLCAATHGNPFAVGEYLRLLLDGGLIRPQGERWACDLAALEALALPENVTDLMLARLAGLGGRTRDVLGVAAVLGARFPLDVLARVTGEDPARAVAEALRAGLLDRTDAGAYAFVHDRVRAAAAAHLADAARRDAHQAIAEMLEAVAEPSPDQRYALARHYAQGHTARNPRRVCEANLEAGLSALEEHANEEAFELLDRAMEMARAAGMFDGVAMRLLEGLGRACAMTGRHARAFDHLEEALRRARSRGDRFRLQYLLTLTYASQGRNDDALASLFEAFRVVGWPFPRSPALQLVFLLGTWSMALLLRATGLGYGRARGEAREQRRVLSQLHYAGSMIALFQGRPLLMVAFIVKDFLNVHFLGPTGETAIATAVYGAVLGTFQLRRVMDRHARRGIAMAEEIGDSAALAVCRAYHAVGTKWAGDLVLGNQMLVEALPDLHRHVPGSWYTAMMICEQAYSYLHAGLSGAAVEHVRANTAQLERTNNLMFRYNTLSVLYAELMVSGQEVEATALAERLAPQYQPLARTIYVGLARCIASLEVLVNDEETGPLVDQEIAAFNGLLSEDYYSSAARVLAGYARLNQLLAARGDARGPARRRLAQATFALSLRALAPVFRCHVFVFRAVLARLDGKLARARRLLDRAGALAQRCGSRRGAYHVAVERARLGAETGDGTMAHFAAVALEIAQSERWRQKLRALRAEFGVREERALEHAGPASTAAGTTTTVVALDHSRRYADALLAVSLASASTLDPAVQAQSALTEVAAVLGAERALFFLLDARTGELELKASTGVGAEQISQTVVRKVVATRAPLVLTGTDDGEALGSASILAYGLRSIMAAPLLVRDRLVGVVYLDSRLAKGMFTGDDVALLLGVSNHIAIAVETARAARLEVERSAFERDFEILGAVQGLLLPKAQTFAAGGVRGAGFYQPAAKCGGDWWWHDTLPDGSVLVLLGDVSGHGAGPAMISSAVAGAYHTMRSLRPEASPPEILAELDRRVSAFGGGFHMTMSAARIDPARRELSLWNAAGPEVFVLRAGRCQCLAAPGGVLGDQVPLQLGHLTVPFGPGDKLLVCTDGVLELQRADHRPLGARRVSQMLTQLGASPIEEARARFGRELNSILGERPQEDDITFVLIEAVP